MKKTIFLLTLFLTITGYLFLATPTNAQFSGRNCSVAVSPSSGVIGSTDFTIAGSASGMGASVAIRLIGSTTPVDTWDYVSVNGGRFSVESRISGVAAGSYQY